MLKELYDFNDYREYLEYALPVSGEGRGSRNRLSEALNCHKGFISQVLSGKAHFSLEHAAKISQVLKHTPIERDFFLLLVHLGRSGSEELSSYYREKLEAIRSSRRRIQGRIPAHSELSDEDKVLYYSSWHYTAIHMCLLVPTLRTRKAMSDFLRMSETSVQEVIDFFVDRGLAKKVGDGYRSGLTRVHLPEDSPLVSKHHANWRLQAMQSLEEPQKLDLHYSSVMSISEDAVEKIRISLLKTIQEMEPVIKTAADETVYTLNVDLFGLSRRI